MTKATESGPEKYLMQIIDGTFRYHGDPGGDGLYVPAVPRSFDLPYEKILSLFREGVAQNKEDPTYQRIMMGVAPGGAVAVWVLGEGIKEVFFGQAQEADIDWERAIEIDLEDREEFVREEIEDTVGCEVLADIQKNGIPFDQWARFRTQYHWKPTFTATHSPQSFEMNFYNGESGRFSFPYEHDFTITTHPIPDKIQFSCAINGQGKKYLYIIHFDEAEMFEAFSRLGSDQQPLQLEFDLKMPKKSTQIRLRNEKEDITLKKFSIEEF